MSNFRALLVLCLAVLPSLSAGEALRVLFIGNSYTHTNNIPGIVGAIAEANGQKLSATLHLPGGRSFQQQWEEGRACALVREGKWDVIVLQNQSYEPVGDPANMLVYAMKFGFLISQYSPRARIVLYNTWAYRDVETPGGHSKKYPLVPHPRTPIEMQECVNRAYKVAAEALGAEIAPVGQAWQLALASRPELQLHQSDASHPNMLGSYLSAVVLHATLFGGLAKELPADLSLPAQADKPGAPLMKLSVSPEYRAFFTLASASALETRSAGFRRR